MNNSKFQMTRILTIKKAKFDVVMEQCYNKMIELYSLGEIKDNVLFHNCGIKNYNRFYKKVSGPTAKYFACYNFAHGYPLFKKSTNLIKTSY